MEKGRRVLLRPRLAVPLFVVASVAAAAGFYIVDHALLGWAGLGAAIGIGALAGWIRRP